MQSVAQCEQGSQLVRDRRDILNTLIGERILHILGEPDGLLTVQVRHLWAVNYRVDVFVGPNVASAKVAHSYFLIADSTGNIIESTPPIGKLFCRGRGCDGMSTLCGGVEGVLSMCALSSGLVLFSLCSRNSPSLGPASITEPRLPRRQVQEQSSRYVNMALDVLVAPNDAVAARKGGSVAEQETFRQTAEARFRSMGINLRQLMTKAKMAGRHEGKAERGDRAVAQEDPPQSSGEPFDQFVARIVDRPIYWPTPW